MSPAPIPRASTVVRRPHAPADIALARTLRGGAWSYPDIQRLLARDGVIVHVNTIRIWADDSARALHARADIGKKARDRAARSGGRLRSNVRSVEFRMVRLAALARAGMTPRAIATVMNFDGLGHGLTVYDVREALRTGRPPRRWRKEPTA